MRNFCKRKNFFDACCSRKMSSLTRGNWKEKVFTLRELQTFEFYLSGFYMNLRCQFITILNLWLQPFTPWNNFFLASRQVNRKIEKKACCSSGFKIQSPKHGGKKLVKYFFQLLSVELKSYPKSYECERWRYFNGFEPFFLCSHLHSSGLCET